ncbi:XdhC family protein [Actinacidiphila glaucinigra]|uniref:Xanthine dehydrogenase accessory factor n=1 Tax=Actinacidiphila glaucinigra TaxID=235986 RepID=A0A239CLY7_9ACTN|nr:XdhC family protein [Actinacidiphila glaucinigra]SNS21165.1 xanthine dehydrogenase accessory factor [Actinacidiphila glaucinigra]
MSQATVPDARIAELTARHVPFVRATVVRARRPASARPGDTAVVLEDGRIEGFVGGVCAEATVRAQALRTLASGEALLLRISPEAAEEGAAGETEAVEGALSLRNPCLSGGELEIFLEPRRPVPRVLVLGETPIARALAGLGPALGYEVAGPPAGGSAEESLSGVHAVVVASHGRDEEAALTAAVRAGVPYVGLVASPRRGAAVVAGLDLTAEQRDAVRTPAGLWIGARTPGEIALSILAEVVASVRGDRIGVDDPAPEPAPRTALDPVCGMTVAAVADTPHSDAGGTRRWFCCEGCRTAFEADPGRYAEVR